jgi:enoyl-CoA hydratase/carnithine racemase
LRAFELFTLKSTLKAQQALDWGLVNQVVSNESLHDCVNAVAKQWMNLPGQSLKNIKQLIRSAPNQNLGTHLLQELEGFVLASQQPDFAERVMQFSQSN